MNVIERGSVIGIIGGGQLGMMTANAAAKLGYKTHIFCPEENAPAFASSDAYTVASYTDEDALAQFAEAVDVITFEFENIPAKSVAFLESHALVCPRWNVLEISQNRLREKDFINQLGIPTAPYKAVYSADDLREVLCDARFAKAILKTTELGYDGKGQSVVGSDSDCELVWRQFNAPEGIVEGFVDFICEISVVVACNARGEVAVYPPAENQHKNGILDVSFVPSDVEQSVQKKAQQYGKDIAKALDVIGLLAVEFFVKGDGELLVNEIAPRPHNSGHWTMDGAETSQFEQFLRAVCNLPLGEPGILYPTRMVNLIGEDVTLADEISEQNAVVHLYGKNEAREGRKMGHVNYVFPPSMGK